MTGINDAVGLRQEAAMDSDLDRLLHPARFHARPEDVVADDRLTIEERRAILSSWASDACAVESNPPLRRPPFAACPVTFDEIMDALQRLDTMTRPGAAILKTRWSGRSSAGSHEPRRAALGGAV